MFHILNWSLSCWWWGWTWVCLRGSRTSSPSTPDQYQKLAPQSANMQRSKIYKQNYPTIQLLFLISLLSLYIFLISTETQQRWKKIIIKMQQHKVRNKIRLTVMILSALSLYDFGNVYVMGCVSLICISKFHSPRFWSCRMKMRHES